MLSLMNKLNYLVTFCCCTFVSIHGRSEDLRASCEVGIMVRRGSTWKTPPQQSLTVSCPVKHCGESLKITWCKFLDPNNCERINEMENVEIRQNHVKDELISDLSFKQISLHDDGLYRCDLIGYNGSIISHAINISVSDIHQRVENSDNNAVMPLSVPNNDDEALVPWLPYFAICVGVALLLFMLTVITLLSSYSWKRVLTLNYIKGEEMPTQMIPELPKWSPPSTPVLHTHLSVLNDIYSSCTAERPESPASQPCGNQPSASNPAVKNQDCAVYAVINHRRSTKPAGKHHTVTNEVKNPEYAVINVS